MIIDLLLQIVVAASLVLVAWHCHEAINMMTKRTKHMTRAGYLALAGGSAIGVVLIVSGTVPHWPSAPVAAGVALIMANQRKCQKVGSSLRNKKQSHVSDPFGVSVQD